MDGGGSGERSWLDTVRLHLSVMMLVHLHDLVDVYRVTVAHGAVLGRTIQHAILLVYPPGWAGIADVGDYGVKGMRQPTVGEQVVRVEEERRRYPAGTFR